MANTPDGKTRIMIEVDPVTNEAAIKTQPALDEADVMKILANVVIQNMMARVYGDGGRIVRVS